MRKGSREVRFFGRRGRCIQVHFLPDGKHQPKDKDSEELSDPDGGRLEEETLGKKSKNPHGEPEARRIGGKETLALETLERELHQGRGTSSPGSFQGGQNDKEPLPSCSLMGGPTGGQGCELETQANGSPTDS